MREFSATPAIGIDIGGTATRIAIVDAAGKMIAHLCLSTPDNLTGDLFTTWLANAIRTVHEETNLEPNRCRRIGLAMPGTLDHARTKLIRATNLPGLQEHDIVDDLATRLGSRPILLTDAEAATWGEYSVRKPRVNRFVHLRVGTGVGCGVVIDGDLCRLDVGRTTHLEELVVHHSTDARRCVCGLRGCLETVASGKALLRHAEELGAAEDLAAIETAARMGNEAALQVVNAAAQNVLVALKSLTRRFRPNVICLGGGVLAHLPMLWERIERCGLDGSMAGADTSTGGQAASGTPSTGQPPCGCESEPPPHLEPANLGDDAGVIGAALLALSGQRVRDL